MKNLRISSAWHVGEIALYMLNLIRAGEKEVTMLLQEEIRITMTHLGSKADESQEIEDVYPEWEERPKITTL